MLKVTYEDAVTGEFITIYLEDYQLNNEHLMPEDKKSKHDSFVKGRIIQRRVDRVIEES